jgi:plastocyanin
MSQGSARRAGAGRRRARGASLAAVAAVAASVAAPALAGPAPGTRANPVKAHSSSRPGFVPVKLVVKPGAVVWFRTTDGAPHTATAVRKVRGRPIFTSGAPSTGRFKIVAPKKAGTYAYFCVVHTFMKGTLIVR